MLPPTLPLFQSSIINLKLVNFSANANTIILNLLIIISDEWWVDCLLQIKMGSLTFCSLWNLKARGGVRGEGLGAGGGGSWCEADGRGWVEEEGWAVVGAGWTGYELNPEWSWQSVIDPFSVLFSLYISWSGCQWLSDCVIPVWITVTEADWSELSLPLWQFNLNLLLPVIMASASGSGGPGRPAKASGSGGPPPSPTPRTVSEWTCVRFKKIVG